LGAVPLLANVVFRYENSTKFVPYLGGGAGGAVSMVSATGTDTDTVFAYQAKTGVAYQLTENVMLDLGYKFFSTAEQSYFLTSPFKLKDVYNHFVGASLTWKF